MNFVKRSLVSLVCVGALLIAHRAQFIPTTTTGGTVVLVLYVARLGPFEKKKDAGAMHAQVTTDECGRTSSFCMRGCR